MRKRDNEQQQLNEDIELGMRVEATKGDLGEQDVSKPKVTDVVCDQHGLFTGQH